MVSESQTRPLVQIMLISIVLSSQLFQTEAANILFFVGFGSASHRMAVEPLADALVARGHNVTFLSQDLQIRNTSTMQYYSPEKLTEFFKLIMQGNANFYDMRASRNNLINNFAVQWFGIKVCECLYTDPGYLEWMNENKFDLVIIDALMNECGYGLAHAHNAKVILFSVSTVLPWSIDGIGVPDETSYIPDVMFGLGPDMSFMDRLTTAVMPVVWRLFRNVYYFPKLTSITREALGKPDFPSISELIRNTSLVFLNTHASQEYPRSLPTNIIPVGGIALVEKKKPLPKKFEDFIAQGREGFVYISFGSFINFVNFPKDVQDRFLNALRRFPHIQFIWKLNKTPENLPANILVEKWMPQQNLLHHPKIRAFITHSGIGGVNEAIDASVPLILFPVLTEQDFNAHLAEKKGFGIKMEITQLSEDGLEKAIKEILSNDSYKLNMNKVSSQFLDRPMKPLDTAVWWTEYALRQDTDFLRPSNVDQYWWVKRQLDVWFFVFLTVTIFNVTGLYLFYKLIKKCCCSKPQKATKTKQKQKKN